MDNTTTRPLIILVGAQLSVNVGAVCRAMKNYGFEKLRLVSPKCDVLDCGSYATSAGAYSIAEQAEHYETLEEALEGYAYAFGFTRRSGRFRRMDGVFHTFFEGYLAEHREWLSSTAFVFGPESTGLSAEDLKRCDFLVKLPTDDDFGSMNLSHAVGCVCYEVARALLAEDAGQQEVAQVRDAGVLQNARKNALESLVHYLDTADYYTKEPKEIVAQRLNGIIHRSMLTELDLQFLAKLLYKLRRIAPEDGRQLFQEEEDS